MNRCQLTPFPHWSSWMMTNGLILSGGHRCTWLFGILRRGPRTRKHVDITHRIRGHHTYLTWTLHILNWLKPLPSKDSRGRNRFNNRLSLALVLYDSIASLRAAAYNGYHLPRQARHLHPSLTEIAQEMTETTVGSCLAPIPFRTQSPELGYLCW